MVIRLPLARAVVNSTRRFKLGQPSRFGLVQWNLGDLNSAPSGCKPDALPDELRPRKMHGV